MPEKSFVTIEVCLLCQKETGNLLMDRRVKDVFEMRTTLPTSLCKECKEKYLANGTLLVHPETGKAVVIKDEAFKRYFNVPIPEGKIAFAEEAIIDAINEGSKGANSNI